MKYSIRVIAIITIMATMLLAALGGCSSGKADDNDHSDITSITIAPEGEAADEEAQNITIPSENTVSTADGCHICSVSFSENNIIYKV